jgi:hypothetical protein
MKETFNAVRTVSMLTISISWIYKRFKADVANQIIVKVRRNVIEFTYEN